MSKENKMRRKAIDCKLIGPSSSSPGYFKYEVTIEEESGKIHKEPAYGLDMQDAISRLVWTERVEKVNPKMIVQARIPQNTAESEPIKMCGSSSVNKVVKLVHRPNANGISPKTAADAVNKTGVRRIPPPSIMASFKS